MLRELLEGHTLTQILQALSELATAKAVAKRKRRALKLGKCRNHISVGKFRLVFDLSKGKIYTSQMSK